ncbi:hypothetical protein [Kitasatospora sp. NPDC056181]|uniref:hypothetical protein n=1 Tax=Kitasatospora sp. NPDC056181 TaxID=3345737 RepID=UPI0035DE1697
MTHQPTPAPAPIAELRTEVRAEHHLFHLVDTAALPSGEADDQPPTPRPGQLATTSTGAVTFNSALSDHYPLITLQYWGTPPAPPTPPWPHHAQHTIEFEGGRLTLTSGVSNLPAKDALSVPAGRYTLTIHRDDPEPTSEPIPHQAEHWLLRLWPQKEGAASVGA